MSNPRIMAETVGGMGTTSITISHATDFLCRGVRVMIGGDPYRITRAAAHETTLTVRACHRSHSIERARSAWEDLRWWCADRLRW